MPEIAEVRVVAKTLKKSLINKKIKKIEIFYPKMIDSNIEEFTKILTNKAFKDIRTYGKWLIFDFGEYSMLSHLRMEGKYFYEESDKDIEKHTHVIFHLDNGFDLRYNDTRKFGKMSLVKTSEIFENDSIKKLGLEPDDKNLSEDYLLKKLSKIKKPIKDSLLDQSIINGLGNIYANEVLFLSNINPLKPSNKITKEEAKKIIKNSKEAILESEKMGGCTIRSYTSSLGVIGHYQDKLRVHTKENEKCLKCKGTIKKIKINGRSTYYCPYCQK